MSPPSSALVKLPKSTPFHLLPLHLRFTFTAAVCETVPQGSSSPLCSTEFSVQAEFSREVGYRGVAQSWSPACHYRASTRVLKIELFRFPVQWNCRSRPLIDRNPLR